MNKPCIHNATDWQKEANQKLRDAVKDFQDRYHSCLDENKKLKAQLKEAHGAVEKLQKAASIHKRTYETIK